MPLLSVRNLKTRFATDRGIVRAVNGVSFDLEEGEILGLVGESGSGKSVTALSIMRLVPEPPGKVTADAMTLDGTDLLGLSEAQAREVRGSSMAMIFQDPMRSLNPVLTIGRQITDVPRSRVRRFTRSMICAWIVTSSAVVASSAISRRGLQESAMAIITRWRMPPENWWG